MTEEFETAGICTGTWWSSSKNTFSGRSLPCSNEICPHVGNFGWQNFDAFDVKEMLSCPESENNCNPSNSTSLPDITLDSTSQIMCLGLSSPATSPPDWNRSILHAEGEADGKLNSNSFFEGLLELTRSCNNNGSILNNTPDEQLTSSWPRTAPILESTFSNVKPGRLGSLPFSDNLFLDESVAVSLFQDIGPNFEEDPQACKSLTSKTINDKAEDLEDVNDESPRSKRPRIETPSPLPSFKVRKEKLGDRITALQQLVSPFGKTDTASVLNEAIEYIKFLHEQVTVLSNPYIKSEAPIQQQQSSEKSTNQECPRQDLRSRGLSLVPISSTFPIATQMNTSGFWTLPFGITLR